MLHLQMEHHPDGSRERVDIAEPFCLDQKEVW
jgi:hypothetical protein